MATEPTKASEQPIPKTGDKSSEEPDKSDGSKANNNNRRNRNRKGKAKSNGGVTEPSRTKFSGRNENLAGYVYDVGSNQADTFIRTTKELSHYIGTKYTMETMMAIKKLRNHAYTAPTMPQVADTSAGAAPGAMRDKDELELNYMEKRAIDMSLKTYFNKLNQYNLDMHQIYAVIVGQCSDAMVQKMKADADFAIAEDNCDPIRILQIIRKICYSCQAEQFAILSLVKAVKRLMSLKQGQKETNVDYLERFDNNMTVCFSCGGHLLFPGALEYISQTDYNLDYHTITQQEQVLVQTQAQELVAATIYLENASDRYSTLKKDLSNDFLKSANNYPMDLVAAQTLLLNYKGVEAAAIVPKHPPPSAELMFAQQAKDKATAAAAGYQPKDLSDVTCNDCNEKGHYQRSPACPVQKKLMDDAEKYRASQESSGSKSEGKQLLMHGIVDDDYDYSEPHLMFCQTSEIVDEHDDNCQASKIVDRMEQLADASKHRSAFEHNSKRSTTHMNWSSNLLNQASGQINEDWCLLDSQSTCNVFTNQKYLRNV